MNILSQGWMKYEYFNAFIRRPVATTLLSIGLVLLGFLAFNILPVASLPRVDFLLFL